ncbi:MAG TPA: invasion associated locus B family protein [Hyphomicrobiaceae bacterium]|nr:invasion associated locus B family protein [Hyphomicrobiaceae bacterium]
MALSTHLNRWRAAMSRHLSRPVCSRPVWLPLALLLAAVLAPVAAPPAGAQIMEGGTVKSQHGDWQVVCRPPPPGAKNEVCGAVQSVTAEDNQNVGLTAIVQKHAGGKLTMRVVAPLGVFLGKALGVQIDSKHEGHVPFDRCLVVGCQAQLLLEPPLMAKLKAGKTLVFIIYRTQEVGVGIPLSLAGFDQAVAALR